MAHELCIYVADLGHRLRAERHRFGCRGREGGRKGGRKGGWKGQARQGRVAGEVQHLESSILADLVLVADNKRSLDITGVYVSAPST